ncbi:hypothetical protein BC826DRAFT_509222 [Russula brevipes]|nr:hypothetical protein BC826DRAFT_509222 [Russula brevipes]
MAPIQARPIPSFRQVPQLQVTSRLAGRPCNKPKPVHVPFWYTPVAQPPGGAPRRSLLSPERLLCWWRHHRSLHYPSPVPPSQLQVTGLSVVGPALRSPSCLVNLQYPFTPQTPGSIPRSRLPSATLSLLQTITTVAPSCVCLRFRRNTTHGLHNDPCVLPLRLGSARLEQLHHHLHSRTAFSTSHRIPTPTTTQHHCHHHRPIRRWGFPAKSSKATPSHPHPRGSSKLGAPPRLGLAGAAPRRCRCRRRTGMPGMPTSCARLLVGGGVQPRGAHRRAQPRLMT